MPPRKRAAAKAATPNTRPKRAKPTRPSVMTEKTSENANRSNQGMVSLDVTALTSTISSVISQAVQTAFTPDNLAIIFGNKQSDNQIQSGLVDGAVKDAVVDITGTENKSEGTGGVPTNSLDNDVRPHENFISMSGALKSRVSSKLQAKIWANECVDFGALLASSPQTEGKYSLSMSPVGSSNQPQLTLKPYHASKRIQHIHQWVSAFSIFVSVYTERHKDETPQLMKYGEVIRDLAFKGGDWIWYNEQFRYIRQSAPDQYPWEQIHWELWLRASSSFRRGQPPTNKTLASPPQRFRSQSESQWAMGLFSVMLIRLQFLFTISMSYLNSAHHVAVWISLGTKATVFALAAIAMRLIKAILMRKFVLLIVGKLMHLKSI